MKLFEIANEIEIESAFINNDAKKMYLIICEMLKNFNSSKKEINKSDFNELIKQKRQDLGLTLEDVAKACNVTKATVMKWENGSIVNVKKDKIFPLAKILQLDPFSLFDFDTASEDYFKLYIFDTLRTFTEILLDYILKISNSSDKLLKEYQLLTEAIRSAENKSEKDEKNVSEN